MKEIQKIILPHAITVFLIHYKVVGNITKKTVNTKFASMGITVFLNLIRTDQCHTLRESTIDLKTFKIILCNNFRRKSCNRIGGAYR